MLRQSVSALLAAALLAVSPAVLRAEPPGIHAPAGLAIGGMDPVGYFVEGRAVPGEDAFPLMWKGATWLFASAENRAAFEADPRRYAPAFGGHCAFSLSQGYIAAGDPEAWAIHEGKLYLTVSPDARAMWIEDAGRLIDIAQKRWATAIR